MDKEHHERNLHLSYRNRENPDYAPVRLVKGELTHGFRNALAYAFNKTIAEALGSWETNAETGAQFFHNPANYWATEKIYQFLIDEKGEWYDTVRTKFYFGVGFEYVAPLIKSGDADDIVTLCDFILRDPGAGQVGDVIAWVFNNNPSAYAVEISQDAEGWTIRYIHPARDEDSAEVVHRSLDKANQAGDVRAREHIREGRAHLKNKKLAAAVGEGRKALDAIGMQITTKPNQDFVKAMLRIFTDNFIAKEIGTELRKYADPLQHGANRVEPITDPDEVLFFLDICTIIVGFASTKFQSNREDDN